MKGLSVIVKNEQELNKLKEFLGDEVLYIDWIEQMNEVETSVIIWYCNEDDFSIGSVGRASYQRDFGIKTVEFSEWFK